MAYADLVFTNGRIFTGEPDNPFTTGVAVTGGKISDVGDVADSVGPKTELLDLVGRLMTPGFIDAHVHTATSGLDLLRVTFDDCDSGQDAIAAVASYATQHPDALWILGSGWAQSWFDRGCPDAELLDAVVSDRPVFISNRDGHGAWVNSKALEIAGLDRNSSDPPDGRIERRGDGSPQGTLHEGAMELVDKHTPDDTVDDFERGLLLGQEVMLRYGITGWQEASVRPQVQEAFLRVANSGRLKGDVVGALWWDRHRGLDQVDVLIERRENSAPGFRPITVKLMLDGVAENFTASVLDPFLDGEGRVTGNRGVDFIEAEMLREIVTHLDAHGFQCHFHALGDRAVRHALDAIEMAQQVNGRSRNRHHLAHLQFVHPDDMPRFASLDAIANVQPLWACNDDYQTRLTRPFITSERDSWQYPFRRLLRVGARMGMGSDWNVSTANVMEEIDVAISRTCLGEGPPLGAAEALTPVEALAAFTMGSAYINHCEKDRGSIAIGKSADIAVFDRDPFPEQDFRDAEVAMTFIGGQVAYQSS